MKKAITILVVTAVVVVIFVSMGPFYILEEGNQAVVVRFGEIVAAEAQAGLKFKMPLLDNVVVFPKRMLSWDGDPRRIPTAENQFIWVDTTARWRISDPAQYYERVNSLSQGYARLDDLIGSAVRNAISNNLLAEAVRDSNIINERRVTDVVEIAGAEELPDDGIRQIAELIVTAERQQAVAKGRRRLSEEMLRATRAGASDLGIEIEDVIIRQIRYSDDLTASVFDRMISERNRIAQAYRSYGEGRKQELLGQMSNEKQSILSDAYRQAEEIRGLADATAAQLYSRSYAQNVEFFEFWRAIESYRATIPRFEKILSTDMDYFRFLYSSDGRR